MKCDSTDILHFAKKQKTCLLKDILKYCQINSWHGVKYFELFYLKPQWKDDININKLLQLIPPAKIVKYALVPASEMLSYAVFVLILS